MEFQAFPKIPRLRREYICITEKIDGTNASIHIGEDGEFRVGSRNRFITPEDDNYGFAAWAYARKDELMALGPGRHYGEWWGGKIGRGYGITERRFSLFNVNRWEKPESRPACCDVVPILYRGALDLAAINRTLDQLRAFGSVAQPGFMRPEGIVTFCGVTKQLYKTLLENDDIPKSLVEAAA
jgi:hypothetical protein